MQNVIVDLSQDPLPTFATASLVTDTILAEGAQKHQVVYNRFQSVISFKPTVATLFSSDEYEKPPRRARSSSTSTRWRAPSARVPAGPRGV